MANQYIVPRPQSFFRDVPAFGLLPETQQPLWKSLFRNVKDALFPEKLPPLQLTSRPVAVREIWTRPNRKKATTGSLVLHALGLAALIALSIIELRPKPEVKPQQTITYVTP